MKTLFQKNIFSVLLLAVVLMITACGGNESQNQESASNESMEQTTMQADTASAPQSKLNINTAGEEAFRTIPDVGDRMVDEFNEYRPYVSIQQFRQEIGKYVDESQVAAYEQYIYVPIHRNDSDAATLMQIPGLDENEAQELISGRPYETNQAFYDALSSYVSDEQLATAKSYIKAE